MAQNLRARANRRSLALVPSTFWCHFGTTSFEPPPYGPLQNGWLPFGVLDPQKGSAPSPAPRARSWPNIPHASNSKQKAPLFMAGLKKGPTKMGGCWWLFLFGRIHVWLAKKENRKWHHKMAPDVRWVPCQSLA